MTKEYKPQQRSDKWVKDNNRRIQYLKSELEWGANYVLIGSSHIVRMVTNYGSRHIWEEFFGPSYIHFANGGNRIEHTLWMINEYNLPGGCDVAVVHIGGNNIRKDHRNPEKIARGIKKVAKKLTSNNKKTLVLLTGILPGKGKSLHVVSKVNHRLEDLTRHHCPNIFYLKPDFKNWLNDKGEPKEELYVNDGLHYSNAGYRLFAEYVAKIAQLSQLFKDNCDVPYVPPVSDPTLRYGITESYTFYSTDCDPGVARGPWYKTLVPPYFNQKLRAPLRAPSDSRSEACKSIGLPGSCVVGHLGANVVYGGEYEYTRETDIHIDVLRR